MSSTPLVPIADQPDADEEKNAESINMIDEMKNMMAKAQDAKTKPARGKLPKPQRMRAAARDAIAARGRLAKNRPAATPPSHSTKRPKMMDGTEDNPPDTVYYDGGEIGDCDFVW